MPVDTGSFGGLGGMAAGAALGSVVPGVGTMLGAGLGGALGGSLGGLFGGGGPRVPDISGELANIRALFAQLRAQAASNINYQAGQQKRSSASDLAARGIYSSPVSQNTYNQIDSDTSRNLASADAGLAGQQAGIESGLMNSLLGLNYNAQLRNAQINAARTGAITGLGGNMLMSALYSRMGAPGGGMSPAGAGGFTGYGMMPMGSGPRPYGYTPNLPY